MRLSELIKRCAPHDPIVGIETRSGIPADIAEADLGLTVGADGSPSTYLLLVARDDEYEDDE